jgi:3-hydroxy acid dehydrogenase/malonic semialdehyde reductase
MNRVRDKQVLITGATAGIGEAVARQFAEAGARLILWGRREDRLATLKSDIEKKHGVSARIDCVDVRDRERVISLAESLDDDGGGPDILINNAGLAAGLDKLHEGDHDDWDRMIDTNVKGLLNVSRSVIPMMVTANRGHIINIGSIAGHIVYPKGNVYNATKFAVRALTEAMNVDLLDTEVRVSSVDPGACDTEFSLVRFHGDKERARTVYNGFEPLQAEDVADAVLYVANTPQHVTISDIVVLPTAQRNPYLIQREGR